MAANLLFKCCGRWTSQVWFTAYVVLGPDTPHNRVSTEDVMRLLLRWIGGFASAFGLIDHRFTVILVIITLLFVVSGLAEQQTPQPTNPPRGSATPPARSTTAKPASMTNADVVNMVAAGLSEQIIIASIRDAKAQSFDVSPNGLIGLKKGGVSDSIIAIMMSPGAAPSANAASTDKRPVPPAPSSSAAAPLATLAPASGAVPPMVAAEAGLYYVGEQGLVRIEAKTPYQTRTGSRLVSRLTLGIKPARINAMLQGLRSDLQVVSAPKFYMHLGQVLGQSESIGEYYLVKFTVKESGGRREIEIGSANFAKFQAGFPEKDLFQMDTKRIDKDIYLMTPKSALGGGEYGILQLPQGSSPAPLPRKIYDFGVR